MKNAPLNRSQIMARVRSRNTRPELMVRKALYAAGFRYQVNRRQMPGSPDIVFPGHRLAVFIHGCFWHQHVGCPRSKMPKANREFWQHKLTCNVVRDNANKLILEQMGWKVLIVWECAIKGPGALEKIVIDVGNIIKNQKKD